ncbi:Mitochondrial distribution and morphology protein 12 [Lobosporangium transversale]|nr:Mitochondrial distribution and morphology protein 12 [Lobosporangium transversale]
MSFEFAWDKLDDEVALQIESMIHAHFQRIAKPTFLGNIAVSKFRFGDTPPSVTVLDVTDPLEEWYVHMDQEEARLAQEAAEAGGGESMDEDELASGDEYDDEYPYSPDGSVVMVGEGDDIEYLGSGRFERQQQLEAEEWLHRQQDIPQKHRKGGASSSGWDSYKEELNRDHRSGVPGLGGLGLDSSAFIQDHGLRSIRSATASPTKISSRASSVSSAGSSRSAPFECSTSPSVRRSRHHPVEHEVVSYTQEPKRINRDLKLDGDTSVSAPSPYDTKNTSARKSSTSHSLSSHPSDDEIESEAFYTQGESTIYQRMKDLVLEHSTPIKAADQESSLRNSAQNLPQQQQPQLGASLFPSTPGGPNGNMGSGLGLGFGPGIGSNPGGVLSSVMQTRSGTRSLSGVPFYSSPTSNSVSATTGSNATTTFNSTAVGPPGPQLYFPDLSSIVVSGNSLLGLRAGTPSRTIPSTPRGFESPTTAFSRRQSFSDTVEDEAYTVSTTGEATPAALTTEQRSVAAAEALLNGLRDQEQDPRYQQHHDNSIYMSPIESYSFDAFPLQPKTVGSLKDDRGPIIGRTSRSTTGQSIPSEQRSRSSSMIHGRSNVQSTGGGNNSISQNVGDHQDRRRRRKREDHPRNNDYDHGGARTPPTYTPPLGTTPSKRHENDIQLLLSVQYQGSMGFTIETELLLNYPTFSFLALPVKLVITGFSFKAKVLMAYLRDHVNVCFLEPEDPNESILSSVRIESQVGDEQKQAVLKNVGKVERFVLEQLRKFITEDFVYPSYHSIELVRPPPPSSTSESSATGTASTSSSQVIGGGNHAVSSRGGSAIPSRPSTAASVATNQSSHSIPIYGNSNVERSRGASRGSAASVTTSTSRAGDVMSSSSSSLRARASQGVPTVNQRRH